MSSIDTAQRGSPGGRPAAGDAEHYRRQLETVAENATLALFIMDERQRCTYMNPAAERLTGYRLEEVQGEPLHYYVHHTRPDGTPYPLEECPIDQAFPQNMRETGEEVFVHRDGHFYPVAFTASPILEGGRPVGTIIEVRDITEEKAARVDLLARDHEAALIGAVGTALTRGGELREVLQGCAQAVVDHLGAAFARVWTLNEAERVLELQASAGMYTHLDGPHGRVPVGAYKIGRIAEEGRPHLTNDVPNDPRVSDKEWARREGMVSFAGYPLIVEGRVLGVMAMFARSPLGERALASLGAVADGIALAIDRHRAEEERERLLRQLAAERARLSSVFQQAPALIAVLRGPEHVFELANPHYRALFGGRELVGQPIRRAIPEIEGQGFFEMLDQVYRSGEPSVGSEVPARIDRRGDGELDEGYFNFVFHPLFEADGSVSGILIHAVEVTALVRARQEVERLEERLRLALDSAEIGTYDWDPAGSELNWDARTRRIFGVPEEGPVGYDAFLELVHPDDRDAANRAVEEALDPAGSGTIATEYRVRRPDGGVRWVRAVGRVFFAGEGEARRPARFLGTVMDVTARRQAEAEREHLIRELAAERTRLAQVFERAPALIAMYSGPDHVVTMVNPTWEKVVGRTGVLGRPLREVVPELEATGLLALLDRVYRTGEPYAGSETRVPLDRDGDGVVEDTYWNFVWQPLAAPEGGTAEIFVHAVEVTDQVRARRAVEEQAEELGRVARALEASNRELDQFAYVASHDLKAPLRGIANLSQWIEEDLGPQNLSEETREHLALLRGRVHRMEGLIDGILQYSRAGRVRDRVEEVDTGRLVAEVVDLLAPPEAVRVEVDPGMPTLRGERLPLQQVFMNLVGNAVKYTRRQDPRVRVRASDAGECWEFAVEDNGPGIAPEYHERIFGLFQTLESRDRVEGTGIGLSIVRKTVESRGGRVWVESEPGAGATFHFTWPKAQEEAHQP